jgi:hypothetical protein
MGCGAAFGYVLWAIVQNQLPQRRTRQQFLKFAISFEKDSDVKKSA